MRTRINNAQNIAAAFLDLARSRPTVADLVEVFPRNIEAILLLTVELPVVYQKDLTLHGAEQYLCALRAAPYTPPDETDRGLLGLLCVGPPANIVFIDSELPEHIQRYVLAHELAHFLVDVFFVRNLWLRSLPERSVEILKAFSWDEYDEWLDFEAFLKGLPKRARSIIGRGKHQLDETDEKELQADLIARELLMPWSTALTIYKSRSDRAQFMQYAIQHFGLPNRIAFDYFHDLQRALAPRPNLFTSLFPSETDPDTK